MRKGHKGQTSQKLLKTPYTFIIAGPIDYGYELLLVLSIMDMKATFCGIILKSKMVIIVFEWEIAVHVTVQYDEVTPVSISHYRHTFA